MQPEIALWMTFSTTMLLYYYSKDNVCWIWFFCFPYSALKMLGMGIFGFMGNDSLNCTEYNTDEKSGLDIWTFEPHPTTSWPRISEFCLIRRLEQQAHIFLHPNMMRIKWQFGCICNFCVHHAQRKFRKLKRHRWFPTEIWSGNFESSNFGLEIGDQMSHQFAF